MTNPKVRSEKKVSIVLPTFNGEKFIKESIDSVLNQTYSNWELIIVNDCSTDNTLSIANEYAQSDNRIKVITNSNNLKLPASLNVGFRMATGEYFTWTSDDNIYKPKALEKMSAYLDEHSDCDMISFNMDFVDEQFNFIKELNNFFISKRTALDLIKSCNVGACFMYRKEIAQKVGKYDENMFCAEDYEYWCRIALNGNIHYADENQYIYRYNAYSLTSTKKDVTDRKTIEIQNKYTPLLVKKYISGTKQQVRFFLELCYNYKNKNWLNYAKKLDYWYVFLLLVKRKVFSILSITKTSNKKIIRILGFKITRPLRDINIDKDDKTFEKHEIRDNSILIVEPNPYHSEILPSFVKYFQDLGFNVDLFLRHENMKDLPINNTDGLNIFKGCALHIKNMLKLRKIKKYEYVFFSSSAYWETNIFFDSYLKYLKFTPKAKHGILMVEHNIIPYLKMYEEEKFLNQNRLFSCSDMCNVPVLSPCYYGNVQITPKSQDNITRFIVVGSLNKDSKNVELLFESIKKLIDNNIENFEIIIDGKGAFILPHKVINHVQYNGRVEFKNLYSDMEKSDYILFLLDDKNPSHDRYKQGTTTGALNLSLGFKKPSILSETFANIYGLNNQKAIVYKENDLYEAMKQAIELSQDAYSKMQENLKVHADEVYKKSLENLKKAVEINA